MTIKPEPGSHLQKAIYRLFHDDKNILAKDPELINHAFDQSEVTKPGFFPQDKISAFWREAEKTLQMIEPHLNPGMRILEVGAGVGLVYALLRSKGFEVIALEPGAHGFGDRHKAGMHLLKMTGIDSRGWLKMGIEDFSPSEQTFDLIFSYFVLEHLSDLDKAFQVMASALTKDGLMIHCCPNYTMPFEPHFNIPLIPFKPEWTALIFPKLQKSKLWKGLRFTSVRTVSKMCASKGLKPVFRRGMTASAFERVLTDPIFAGRKQNLIKLAKLLQSSGMLRLIYMMPSTLDTPMEFTARKI